MYDTFQTDRLIDLWLAEDIGYCDLTAQVMIEPHETGAFVMNARETLIVAGIDVAVRIFKRYDPLLDVTVHVKDGDTIEKGTIMLTVRGNARSVLTAERTALNIVQRLSGIANLTAEYVAAVAGTRARLIDTRKTTPGLRMLEKHAVTCGIAKAVERARRQLPVLTKLEVECDRLDQVREALEAGVDVIMLDNMSVADMAKAVDMVGGRTKLEASGGISLATIDEIAKTGVDYISTSKINQASSCVDIGLDEAE
jgi:nicotinate-nucleotide pyrophosphorylase (carboxylating)